MHDINVNKAYGNISLNKRLVSGGLSNEDKGLATELVFGTLRWMRKLDYIIGQFSNIPVEKITPVVLDILRLGTYQLVFMDRIPDSAAVDESVKLAKKYRVRSASGFVNGVLRNIARKVADLEFPKREERQEEYLSVIHSHPKWMVGRWLKRYGFSFTEELLQSNNEKADFTIRVNTLKNSKDELAASLERKGYKVGPGEYVPDALTVENPSGIMETQEYADGMFVIQDEGSMLVTLLLAPAPGDIVVDLCSAPGGKATYLAQLMQNRGVVRAWDIHEHRLKLLDRNKLKTGASIIRSEMLDASVYHEELTETCDKLLADVPCSGLGTIRRRPDIKWARREEEIAGLASLQKSILNASARYLKPGGALVYSTCTIEPEENEEVVSSFLRENSGFFIEHAGSYLPENLQSSAGEDGMVRLFPNRYKTDGFFMARIRRTPGTAFY